MNVFKPLLKQTLKQMRRLHYFMAYPDIIGADPDAIGDPFRREYIKGVKRRMMNGEPIPDIVRVRHDERCPAVEMSPKERATRDLMEKLARRAEELLQNEKVMEHLRDVGAMVDQINEGREWWEKIERVGGGGGVRRKSRAGERNGGHGRKSQAGGRGGRPKKKTNTG